MKRSPLRHREASRSSALKVFWEIILNSRLPTPFLLVHSIGNSSLLWSLFKVLFLSMSFSDLLLVSFDWQKSSRSYWKLILERIEILSLRVLQSVSRQRLCVKRPVDTCACSWSFCDRFTTLGLFEVSKLRPFEERDMERQLYKGQCIYKFFLEIRISSRPVIVNTEIE